MGFEYILGGVVALAALLFALMRGKKSEGKAEARAEISAEAQKKIDEAAVNQAHVEVQQVEEAREIHDRLESDPAYADSVRTRFQRD